MRELLGEIEQNPTQPCLIWKEVQKLLSVGHFSSRSARRRPLIFFPSLLLSHKPFKHDPGRKQSKKSEGM